MQVALGRGRGCALLVAVLALALPLTACSSTAQTSPSASRTTTSHAPVTLSFAVYGPAPVRAAYAKVAAEYTAKHPGVTVDVEPYKSHADALGALGTGDAAGTRPDLFLADQTDLPTLVAHKRLRHVDDLLGERGVNFGDGFQRIGLEEFSADTLLQCMPVEVSPMVLFVNTRLLDSTEVNIAGQPHDITQPFSMAEWAQAAEIATGPGHRAVYVAATLAGIAPFVWSAGGDVVDDPNAPTRLTLEDGNSAAGMEKLLEIVRNPRYTFPQAALRTKSALRRFEDGQLAMLPGYRDLVPLLRAKAGLEFDVMPLPRIKQVSSVGQATGACIDRESPHVAAAADFIAYLVSDAGATPMAESGYVVPTNLEVLNDDAFLQPDELPAHAAAFAEAVRGSQALPSVPAWPAVAQTTAQSLAALFYDPVIDPLGDRLTAIDQASVPLFAPASPGASPTATGSPTGGATQAATPSPVPTATPPGGGTRVPTPPATPSP